MNWEEVKQKITDEVLANGYVAIDGHPTGYKVPCPFGHNGQTDKPSTWHARYDSQTGVLHCFGNHGEWKIKDLASYYGIDLQGVQASQPRPKPQPKPLEVPTNTPLFWDVEWEYALEQNPELIDWLEGRGVNSFCRLHGRLGYTNPKNKQNHSLPASYLNKLLIPRFNDTGQVVAVKTRSMPWQEKFYSSFTGGSNFGLYGRLYGKSWAVIVESELDCLALMFQLGNTGTVAACPLTAFNEVCAAQIPRGTRTLFVAIDRDGEKLYQDVKAQLPRLQVICLRSDPYKDIGECIQNNYLPEWVDQIRSGYHPILGRAVNKGEIVTW